MRNGILFIILMGFLGAPALAQVEEGAELGQGYEETSPETGDTGLYTDEAGSFEIDESVVEEEGQATMEGDGIEVDPRAPASESDPRYPASEPETELPSSPDEGAYQDDPWMSDDQTMGTGWDGVETDSTTMGETQMGDESVEADREPASEAPMLEDQTCEEIAEGGVMPDEEEAYLACLQGRGGI